MLSSVTKKQTVKPGTLYSIPSQIANLLVNQHLCKGKMQNGAEKISFLLRYFKKARNLSSALITRKNVRQYFGASIAVVSIPSLYKDPKLMDSSPWLIGCYIVLCNWYGFPPPINLGHEYLDQNFKEYISRENEYFMHWY